MNSREMRHRLPLLVVLMTLPLFLVSCGGSGTPPAPQPVIDFHKNRDVLGRVAPVLSDRATADPSSVPTDFDWMEVDSPCSVEDPSRFSVTGDPNLLYYEATDGLNLTVIGLITSDEPTFDPIVLPRTVVMSPAQMPDLDDNGSLFSPYGAADPSVLYNSAIPIGSPGRYQMWFEGRYGTLGLISAILTCSSSDGVTWDAPVFCTGLEPGAAFGTVARVADPSVVRTNEVSDSYRMVFEVERSPGSVPFSLLGAAISDDGIAWTIRDGVLSGDPATPIFTGGPGSFDDYSIQAPSLLVEFASGGAVSEWVLFYEADGVAGLNDTVIGFATSLDGYSWSGFNLAVLEPSSDLVPPPPLFDSDDLKHPAVIQPDNYPGFDLDPVTGVLTPIPRFWLYYTGDNEGSPSVNRIGLATGG